MTNKPALTKTNQMIRLMDNPGMQGMFENALKENAGAFISSLIDLYNGDNSLQQCDPKEVAMEALKAATLGLPINKTLGYAYIMPFKNKPTFVIGYKGLIQLAIRTGQYKFINVGEIMRGEKWTENRLTGEAYIEGHPDGSNDVVGYFAYFQLVNGYEKSLYMSKEEVEGHGKKYSQAYNSKFSPWKTNFEVMAKKTVLKLLLGRFGLMTTEMRQVEMYETDQEVIHLETEDGTEVVDMDTGEILEPAEPVKKVTEAPF